MCASVKEPVMVMKLTAMLAPDNAKEGVLHNAEDVDTHLLVSQDIELIVIAPELETEPNFPPRTIILEPVVGEFVAFT